MLRLLVVLTAVIGVAAISASKCIDNTTIITTTAGDVVGTSIQDHNITAFLGIPYAQPPTGTLRFAPPRPKSSWQGVRNASQYGDVCHTAGDVFFGNSGLKTSEDCLHINVFVPPNTTTESAKPVVIYIHGGGFIMGGSNFEVVSPRPYQFLVECDCVYVNFNYRLGPLGFMALEEMRQEHGYAGVLGLMDQQLAFRWVQDNIRSFGGDPNQVTVMGESAGAFCLCFHLVSPQSAGLFNRVILQSAMCDMEFQAYEEAVAQGNRLTDHVGCKQANNRLECLRSLPATTIQKAFNNKRGLLMHTGVRWFPVIDYELIPDYPVYYLRDHKSNPVDILIGNNADEASLFLLIAFNVAVFESSWRDLLPAAFPEHHRSRVEALFPPHWSAYHKMAALLDNMISCSTLRTALALAKDESSHVFVYHYSFIPETFEYPLSTLGAFHGSELRFLFEVNHHEMSPAEEMHSEAIQRMWYTFIRGGTHHLRWGNLEWPRFNTSTPLFLDFHNGNLSAHSTRPVEQWEETRHRLDNKEPLFVNDTEPSPFAFCPFFDSLLTEDKHLMQPPADFEEAWISYFVNILLVRFVRTYGKQVLAVVVAVLVAWIVRCIYRKQTRKQTK
eukprot:m.175929 g.175929  ORF g.175929 m.175929 type:complete len:613 (+) comp16552_c10_seq2:113-1951(+)